MNFFVVLVPIEMGRMSGSGPLSNAVNLARGPHFRQMGSLHMRRKPKLAHTGVACNLVCT